MALNSGQGIHLEAHLKIMADNQLDVMSRASAIQMLSYTTKTLTVAVLKPYLTHQDALLRLSAAGAASLLSPSQRAKHLSPLLSDQYKAVRIAAARSLVDTKMSKASQTVFNQAFAELVKANQISSWRGEGRANQGVLAMQMNKPSEAEKAFKGAILVEPYYATGYINLADLYRAQQRPLQVGATLKQGIAALPRSGPLHYSYGLYLVRQKKLAQAVSSFAKAMALSPFDSQYAYTYVLALDGSGQSEQALEKLKTLMSDYQDQTQLKQLGLYLSQKLNNKSAYDWFNAR
jgi:tetratricopeptide (TPR) repeat protein